MTSSGSADGFSAAAAGDGAAALLARHGSYYAWLTALPDYGGQAVAYRFFPPHGSGHEVAYGGRWGSLLGRLGFAPYRHQVEALLRLEQGDNVVVATPTASGKSLIYQLPALAAAEEQGTGLLLFPTKALAQDQLGKLAELARLLGLDGRIASYDGDTPTSERGRVRQEASCVLSNPDMLHFGILPFHEVWGSFLARLQLVVIDELHSYRGVFGAHVANVLRRLARLAAAYGARPRWIATSATIGNPAEHAADLTGQPFTALEEDDAPKGAREFLFWQPMDLPGRDGRRRSPTTEAAWLAAHFVREGVKSIFFCNSRKAAELLRRYAAGQLSPEEGERLRSYRAGYTREDRRALEEAFRRNEVQVMTATSALELGVDIGGMDAVVMVGYPGSLMALWQRAGRAGRDGRRALALLIPGNDPLDEYYLRHPDLLTEGAIERAVADPFNDEIHPSHVVCAAAELPLSASEEFLAPWLDPAELPGLVRQGGRWRARSRYPHRKVRVRGAGGRRVILRDGGGNTLGQSDAEAALRELHPGAVYLHQGESYLVMHLDLERGEALLVPHIEDYFTQPRSDTDIEVLEDQVALAGLHFGRVRVTTEISGYVKKRYFSEAVLDERLLDLPPLSYATQALWFGVGPVAGSVAEVVLPSAMHALEHAMIGLLPAFVLCERADVGGVSYPRFPASGEPTVFIYDGSPGGVGYARAGVSVFRDWLLAARDLLRDCPCPDGCPRCVLSPKCGNGNQVLDKTAALALAEALLDWFGAELPAAGAG